MQFLNIDIEKNKHFRILHPAHKIIVKLDPRGLNFGILMLRKLQTLVSN